MPKKLALIIALSIAPTGLLAQGFAAPGYSTWNNQGFFPMSGYGFGGMPGGFQNGVPPFYSNGTGGGFPGAGQNPNWATPNGQFGGPFPPNYMQTQPTPYWMQSPQPNQRPGRYIEEIPRNQPPRGQNSTAAQTPPPRWAPLPGQAPVHVPPPRPSNNWSISPMPQPTPSFTPATPPKWPPLF